MDTVKPIPISLQQQQQHQESPPPSSFVPANEIRGTENDLAIQNTGEPKNSKQEEEEKVKPPTFDDRSFIVKAKYHERLAGNAFRKENFEKACEHYRNAAKMYAAMITSAPTSSAACTLVKLRDFCLMQANAIQRLKEEVDALTKLISEQKKELPNLAEMSTQELVDYTKEYDPNDRKTKELLNALVARIEELTKQLKPRKD